MSTVYKACSCIFDLLGNVCDKIFGLFQGCCTYISDCCQSVNVTEYASKAGNACSEVCMKCGGYCCTCAESIQSLCSSCINSDLCSNCFSCLEGACKLFGGCLSAVCEFISN